MTESRFANVPANPTHLEDLDGLVSQTEIVKILRNEAQRRGFRRPSSDSILNSTSIPLALDELVHIPVPKYFLCDLVIWNSLPGEEADPPEGGIVIGMKWVPIVSETPTFSQDSEWEYLIHLDKSSPSRALGISLDWAVESNLIRRDQIQPEADWVDSEG